MNGFFIHFFVLFTAIVTSANIFIHLFKNYSNFRIFSLRTLNTLVRDAILFSLLPVFAVGWDRDGQRRTYGSGSGWSNVGHEEVLHTGGLVLVYLVFGHAGW